MANNENLKKGKSTQFQSGEQAEKNGRKGGIASGQARREKKTIQSILSELLDGQIKDSPQFAKLASKLGIESDKSIKDLLIAVATVNTLKKADFSELGKLSKLLGEEADMGNIEQEEKHNELIEALKARNEDKRTE